MVERKVFTIETVDHHGMLLKRFIAELEDNPAYGDETCRLVLSNDPKVHAVSILEPIYDELGVLEVMDDPKHPGRPLVDGLNNPRYKYVERMRYARHVNRQDFGKAMENWNEEKANDA